MKNIHILPTDKPSRLFITDNKLFNYHKPQQGDNVKIINQNIYITSDEHPKPNDFYFDFQNQKVKKCETGYYNKGSKKIILTDNKDLIKDGVRAIDDEFLEWFVKNPSCERVEVQKGFEDGTSYDYNFLDYKIIIPKEEPKPFKNMLPLTKVDWEKFKKNPIPNKKEETLEEVSEYDVMPNIVYGENVGERIKIKAKIITKEEPKQETIEEDSKFYFENDLEMEQMIKEMALTGKVPKKWSLFISKINNLYKQQERMYSEEEVYDILIHHTVELFKKEKITLEDFWNKFKK